MTESRSQNFAAFISYSHEDAELVGALFDLLRSMGSVFLDKATLVPGDRWRTRIDDAISSCAVFLLFWCQHSSVSNAVQKEYHLAVSAQKRVVPVLLDITPLPEELREFQWVDLRRALYVHFGAHRPHHEFASILRVAPESFPELDLRELDRQLLRMAFGDAGEAVQ
jgi:TIR domain